MESDALTRAASDASHAAQSAELKSKFDIERRILQAKIAELEGNANAERREMQDRIAELETIIREERSGFEVEIAEERSLSARLQKSMQEVVDQSKGSDSSSDERLAQLKAAFDSDLQASESRADDLARSVEAAKENARVEGREEAAPCVPFPLLLRS